MTSGRQAQPGWFKLVFLLIIGGITGSIVGEIIIRWIPAMQSLGLPKNIGLSPVTLDLSIFTLTFGFSFSMSLFTILGMIMAYVAYRRI